MRSIVIRGREYRVEPYYVNHGGELRYRLIGARGAVFFTLRNVNRPHTMFVVAQSIGNRTLDGVWLSDGEDGELRVIAC